MAAKNGGVAKGAASSRNGGTAERGRVGAKGDGAVPRRGDTEKTAKSEVPASSRRGSSVPPEVEEVLSDGGFTVERFVECFDVLVEAAGGTERLRELVLELGIGGRLAPANSPDLHSSGILSAIAAAQVSAVYAGDIDAPPTAEAIRGEEMRHDLPRGWSWARLSQVALTIQIGPFGSLLHQSDYVNGGTPLVNPANIKPPSIVPDGNKTVSLATLKRLRHYVLRTGDIVMGRRGEMGKCAVVGSGENGWLCGTGSLYVRLTPHMESKFIALWLRSPSVRLRLEGESVGATMNNLNLRILNSLVIAVPPLSAQKTIVAHVDQLMALIDELEAKQTRKRELGTRFIKASLDALTTAESPEEFDTAWKRVVENWETVLDGFERVAELRHAILALGLRGRLVSSRRNSDALAELRRNRSGIHALQGTHIPHAIPSHWVWIRLNDLLESLTDGDHQPPPQVPSGIPFLTIGNVSTGRLDFRDTRYVPASYFEALDSRRVPRSGDILYTVVGASYGRPVLVNESRPFCVQRHIAILRPDGTCLREYLYAFLRSELAYSQATRSITGTAQPTVPLRPLREFIVPIPPLAEQRLVVLKIEHFMKHCDELEAKLRRAEDRASKLTEAVVAEMVG